MKISPWLVVDGYCATRIVEGGDVENVLDRVAFIEKTPRIRMGTFEPDHKNWKSGPKGCGGSEGCDPNAELYGFYLPSREWCDRELALLGYEI